MATAPNSPESLFDRKTRDDHDVITAADVLKAIGSLKLTVALFAASLIIVLVGTLAQDELNMQDVKLRYFTSWIAWLHFDDFLPQAFYPHAQPIPGVIPFPGGALIGALLMLNLIASKATRFRISASGSRLAAGIVFLLAGFSAAGLIIASGHSSDGLQGAPPISYLALWRWVQAFGIAAAIGLTAASINVRGRALRIAGFVAAALLGAIIVYTLVSGVRISDPGLRIVWQLTKGLGAGVILLVGCILLFGRQGGNLLLHLGVGLLMVGQFAFGDRQLEQRISLVEGASTNSLINLDKVELAFINSQEGKDEVTAIPGSRLEQASRTGDLIQDPSLPVDVKVLNYFENSDLTDPKPDNPATVGLGKQVQATPARKRGGTDSEVNVAAAYVQLIDKDSGKPLETHLVSQMLSDRETLIPDGSAKDVFDTVRVDDTDYKLGLKYHREVKPYWVQLEDVQRRNYSGTETPRDYSSYIRIVDPETGEDRRERVWMNNPLRYRGETFFQSSYTALPGGKELTGLQVVRNSGWLIPYVACSIMALGMLAHFLGTLKRFVGRRERETTKELAAMDPEERRRRQSSKPIWIAMAVAGAFGLVALIPWSAVLTSLRPQTRDYEYDFYTAGKIPTQFGGRIMPLDAFARQTLKAISNRESLPLDNAPGAIESRAQGKKLSAMQWLMEVAVDEPALRYLPMFRVDAEEVRSELKLERRESKLYSLDELLDQWSEASDLIQLARNKDVAAQSFKEKKLLELDRRTRQYMLTAEAFQLPRPPEIPTENLPEGITEAMVQQFAVSELQKRMQQIQQMPAARIIPPSKSQAENSVNDPDWMAFAPAFFEDAAKGLGPDDGSPLVSEPFSAMIKSYADEKKDYEGFNEAVDAQLALSRDYPIAGFNTRKVGLERWMESNAPSLWARVLYLVGLVMGLGYFALGGHRLRNATWGVLFVALLIHSATLLSRIYITGRAPVINIYSSAVFIGWAAVLFGLVAERIFKLGFGNMLAATAGALTLFVANGLSSGDTMPVLQAVLDTQFWLATHVISVSLGYVATLVGGTLGIGYLISCWAGMSEKAQRSLYRMIYGAACFGILFSTVGTILGGLWADDSWGRFWGWDPKENGALLIVIWNALMLHARWDGMVKALGFSILAIGGNIVTAWSWFGTNELGIGLHSYGFTQGVLMWLSVFIGTQVAFIIAGLAFPPEKPVS
ncbi:cytochrome C biogenesis protein [Roseiconus nitratireducens]|uniref:Cytochrome C biogenesis protein n=1 Tax=Roseiconus nitratireducens TaxID=2605748 RepID=A0A5M6DDD0_9BACT|nr:cytochrome c biogenesis protein CcsA [Roseiconus nitratireducens]KAA5544466.1 cytochrome C biogenesis protein [Roseiconus nitratireducens]